ncbi:DNA repair protein XRCC4-like [Ceratina calcarata]|uniref:DNA repair protein XRCC4-like n=1 Tax=Ceratina calcarata TaxID=156304 RepID=A0AAJ7S989_9HYME|nr:DNA repair protein XRCC4-like [Ceratina calcarata]
MSRITGCEIFNQNDDKYMLYAEWYDSYFKIILMETAGKPLIGEMSTDDVNDFSRELSKSSDEYFEETKRIFCGKDKTINFLVTEETFQWRNKLWTLGKIKLSSPSDTRFIYQSFQQLLKIYQPMQDKMNTMGEENKILIDTNKELSSKVNQMIKMKTAMERDLYKKFVLVLNSKKKKLRELERKVGSTNEESVYNASTDEGESEEEKDIVEKKSTRCTIATKRKSTNKNVKDTQESKKKIISYEINPKPSTSKEGTTTTKLINYEEQSCSSEHRKSTSSLNFFEEVPEEDLFS